MVVGSRNGGAGGRDDIRSLASAQLAAVVVHLLAVHLPLEDTHLGSVEQQRAWMRAIATRGAVSVNCKIQHQRLFCSLVMAKAYQGRRGVW